MDEGSVSVNWQKTIGGTWWQEIQIKKRIGRKCCPIPSPERLIQTPETRKGHPEE